MATAHDAKLFRLAHELVVGIIGGTKFPKGARGNRRCAHGQLL